MKFYRLDDGIIVDVLFDDDSTCKLGEIKPQIDGDKQLKHRPIVKYNGNRIDVEVGKERHPMTDEHYIDFIIVETNKGIYRKYLENEPKESFVLDPDEEFLNCYIYCNLHGLWSYK